MSRLLQASGREARRPSLGILEGRCLEGRHRRDGEKWPFIFDGSEREGELTVIQTASPADLWLRISHAGSECGELGGQWPPPPPPCQQGPPEKEAVKKRDTLTPKWCLTACGSKGLSTWKHAIPFSSNNWEYLPVLIFGLTVAAADGTKAPVVLWFAHF